jgi:hypothetical protein
MAKFKRTDTGEIVNVVSWGANGTYTDYYDSKGEFHHTDLNRYNYFEEIIESPQSGIDWEQRKYDLAKDMFSRMMVAFNTDNDKCGFRAAVKNIVLYKGKTETMYIADVARTAASVFIERYKEYY